MCVRVCVLKIKLRLRLAPAVDNILKPTQNKKLNANSRYLIHSCQPVNLAAIASQTTNENHTDYRAIV